MFQTLYVIPDLRRRKKKAWISITCLSPFASIDFIFHVFGNFKVKDLHVQKFVPNVLYKFAVIYISIV